MKKIISWNVASIRARMDLLLKLLADEKPDIVFLQEIKIEEEKFPYMELKAAGYEAIVSGQKAWNGVAILSKEKLTLSATSLETFEEQARFIEGIDKDGTHFISVYVPNGQAPATMPEDTSRLTYKLEWMSSLKKHLEGLKNYIIGGDFNVILKDEDVYNPALFTQSALMVPSVRAALQGILTLPIENPLRAQHNKGGFYTFWDFQGGAIHRNHGIFLDYIFLSSDVYAKRIGTADVLKVYRTADKPSDHAPIFVELVDK